MDINQAERFIREDAELAAVLAELDVLLAAPQSAPSLRKISDNQTDAEALQAQGSAGVAADREASTPVILLPSLPSALTASITKPISLVSFKNSPGGENELALTASTATTTKPTPERIHYSSSDEMAPAPSGSYKHFSLTMQKAIEDTARRRAEDEAQEEAKNQPSRQNVVRLHVPANENSKPWRYLSTDQKTETSLIELEKAGAQSYALTFSARKEAELRQAAKDGKNVGQMILDAVAHQFRRRRLPVPAIVFALEEAPGSFKLHVHGVYLADPSLSAETIRECFKHAGGYIKGQPGSTQFWHRVGYDLPFYVLDYACKRKRSVMRRLNLDSVVFVNDRMRAIGRDWHNSQRAGAQEETLPARATTPTTALGRLLALDFDTIPDRFLPIDGNRTDDDELEQLLAEIQAAQYGDQDAQPIETQPDLRLFLTSLFAIFANAQEGPARARQVRPSRYTKRPPQHAPSARMSQSRRLRPRSTSPPKLLTGSYSQDWNIHCVWRLT